MRARKSEKLKRLPVYHQSLYYSYFHSWNSPKVAQAGGGVTTIWL